MTQEQTQKLEELGVNISETLERFVDNEGLYFRCLNKFNDDRNYSEMLSAIKNNDASGAFEAAHALKGVTANLGLSYLFEQIKIITEVFRAGNLNYKEDNLNKITYEYERALATIKTF